MEITRETPRPTASPARRRPVVSSGMCSTKSKDINPDAVLQTARANPLTYPKSTQPFSIDLFRHPSSEYRGCPLWAWNSRLRKEHLLRQIDHFQEMGMGGFHMHVRTGLDTEYMGPEFMDRVRDCVEYAESKDMLACLYDEDRWPSGSAGGKVIRDNPEYKAQHILFTPHPYGTVEFGGGCNPSSAQGCRSENGHLLATYSITLDDDGNLKASKILKTGEAAGSESQTWYAYVETNPSSPWFNDQTYVDSMSKDAMARFIEITHEVYKDKIGDKFGSTVPCIFTDEPQVATKTQLSNPAALEDVFLPWTTDLAESFGKAYGTDADLISELPQLVWNLPQRQPSLTRYRFHDHVSERFVSAFLDQLGNWCEKNKILLNGHMMEEPTLWSQTTAHGEAMRCYRNQQLPGIDLLNDWVEYNTAKQASSVARQKGVRGTMSEIYGCTHWYFTFEGHTGCGNWQAALGITFRVQHLTWVSMAGEGKRDYPASIGYQSPWYKEYRYVEDHFARVGVAMTRGKPVTRVAVIHPIESFWLCFGPNGSGDDEMELRNNAFADLTDWLLHGLIDFDFISESLLPDQIGKISKTLRVGECQYDVVILPNLRTIRSTTLRIIKDFAAAGGKVVIAGNGPQLVDAQSPQAELAPTIEPCIRTSWDKWNILSAIESYRDVLIALDGGKIAHTLLYQMREDGDERFLFVCNTDRNSSYQTNVKLKGIWNVEMLDTFTGGTTSLLSEKNAGWTWFPHKFEGCGSLLLRLSPHNSEEMIKVLIPAPFRRNSLPNISEVGIELREATLSEPNVLLLDYAAYKVDSEDWLDVTEVLKIDNEIRSRLKMPRKGMAWKQPWAVPAPERSPKAQVTLRFEFHSDIDVTTATKLAIEDPLSKRIHINEVDLSFDDTEASWWVDEDIKTLAIPENVVRKGKNTIILTMPFGILTNIERIYLLGDFGVRLEDNRPIIRTREDLQWGNITTQGLPFYVGNITYNCRFNLPSRSKVTLSVPQFSSPLLKVSSDEESGHIALQPRMLVLGTFAAGTHTARITAFGNSCWPELWRAEGWAWSEEYRLKPVGILEQPSLLIESLHKTGDELDWVLVNRPVSQKF